MATKGINYKTYKGYHPDLTDNVDIDDLVDSQGKYRTRSLFVESFNEYTAAKREAANQKPLYSLKERNTEGVPSAYLIYMASADEFEAALKLVGSLAHWDELCKCKWFMEPSGITRGLKQWRIDMARRNASIGIKTTIAAAKQGDGASARKLLDMAGSDLIPYIKRDVGRPSNRKVAEAEAEEARMANQTKQLEQLYKSLKK